jgi:hypothetical protein
MEEVHEVVAACHVAEAVVMGEDHSQEEWREEGMCGIILTQDKVARSSCTQIWKYLRVVFRKIGGGCEL